MGEVQDFMLLINSKRISQVEKDRILWKGDAKGYYNVWAIVTLLEKKNSFEFVME